MITSGTGKPNASETLFPDAQRLPRRFYARDTVQVARDCLGKILVHGVTAGLIVETEAYLGVDDLAAHASHGLTQRTRVLFENPGHAYLYLIYGLHVCLNFVADAPGKAGCVLIRALEPLAGIPAMRQRRPAAKRDIELMSGPGKLTQALQITRKLNGSDLVTGPIEVLAPAHPQPFQIVVTPRIGITHCANWPLRFLIRGNRCVSGKPTI